MIATLIDALRCCDQNEKEELTAALARAIEETDTEIHERVFDSLLQLIVAFVPFRKLSKDTASQSVPYRRRSQAQRGPTPGLLQNHQPRPHRNAQQQKRRVAIRLCVTELRVRCVATVPSHFTAARVGSLRHIG